MYSFDGKVRIYTPVLDRMLNSPSGETGRLMARIGRQIQAGGKARVRKRSGRLARSIKVSQYRDTRGQVVKVGSNLKYAYYEHEGTRPHVINPRRGRVVTFRSGGRRVFARVVLHPGTRGSRFLVEPMRAAVRGL